MRAIRHSMRRSTYMAARFLLIEWLTILIAMPALAFGIGQLLHITLYGIWYVIIDPHHLLLIPITLMLAGVVWSSPPHEGNGLRR